MPTRECDGGGEWLVRSKNRRCLNIVSEQDDKNEKQLANNKVFMSEYREKTIGKAMYCILNLCTKIFDLTQMRDLEATRTWKKRRTGSKELKIEDKIEV